MINTSYQTYHTIYQTTNNVNGKFYIGVHSTNNPTDEYLGSGYLLKRAIIKYGVDAFHKDVLCLAFSRQDAFNIERLLIAEARSLVPHLLYNLAEGGEGHAGPNKNSKRVLIYNQSGSLVVDFDTIASASRFLSVYPSLVNEACNNALNQKSSRVGTFWCCYENSSPVKKDTRYLTEHNRHLAEKNRGKKRPEHGAFVRQMNLNRPAAMKKFKFIHTSGIKFEGTRTELRDTFPHHKLISSELSTLVHGKCKTHHGWSVEN